MNSGRTGCEGTSCFPVPNVKPTWSTRVATDYRKRGSVIWIVLVSPFSSDTLFIVVPRPIIEGCRPNLPVFEKLACQQPVFCKKYTLLAQFRVKLTIRDEARRLNDGLLLSEVSIAPKTTQPRAWGFDDK